MHQSAKFFLTGAKYCTNVNYRFANGSIKNGNLKKNLTRDLQCGTRIK
nr:MAG TPA: hypothetical protein [Caudoviricetes sp.]